MRIDELTDIDAFFNFEGDWRELFSATPQATPFQSWEWLSSWWKHKGKGQPWILVSRDGERVLAAMALVITSYRGTMFRQVRWMGAPLSDYQDFVGAGRREESAAAFLSHLAAQRIRWDLCDLNDLRTGSSVPTASFAALDGVPGFHRRCPVVALPTQWAEYRKNLGPNLRATLNRRRRQLDKTFRSVEMSTVEDPNVLSVAIDDLIRTHSARWRKRGLSGALSSPSTQAFHREVARRFFDLDMLRLHRLMIDGECGAALYCMRFRRCVYYYLGGFRPELKNFSPGVILMGYAIERAIAEGAREFDMLRGDEPYKYAWRAKDRVTQRLVAGNGSFASRIALAAHSVERWIERRGLVLQRFL